MFGEELRRISPYLTVVAWPERIDASNAERFVAGCDVVVDGIDFLFFEEEFALHDAARRAEAPVHISQAVGSVVSFTTFAPDGHSLRELITRGGRVDIAEAIRLFFPVRPAFLTDEVMAWVYLIIAGVFEVAWAIALKASAGFTRLGPSVAVVLLGFVSFVFLALAMKRIPIGTAYAVWTGIGTVGTALYGMAVFQEPKDSVRLVCIGLILAGVVGLRLASRA